MAKGTYDPIVHVMASSLALLFYPSSNRNSIHNFLCFSESVIMMLSGTPSVAFLFVHIHLTLLAIKQHQITSHIYDAFYCIVENSGWAAVSGWRWQNCAERPNGRA